jgi:hypothetical protein
MSEAPALTNARLLPLVRISLATWGLSATVDDDPGGALCVALDDGSWLRVGRAPPGIPFRWMVTTSTGRERPASSVTGLLRVLRSTLDPSWRPGRARIAVLPPVP